jgi:hypothetical protein
VRSVIQQSLAQLTHSDYVGYPLDECAVVLAKAAEHASTSSTQGPLAAESGMCPPLGPTPFHGRVWAGTESDDGDFQRAFRYIVSREHLEPLCPADPGSVEALRSGVRCLEKVAPELARSVLSHTQLIALFSRTGPWARTISVSQFRVVGVVFLARELLDNPWLTAEHILHESLHQKIYDLRHAHSVLRADVIPDDHPEDGRKVVALWNRVNREGSNQWDLNRSLAALHVYTHLAVYASLAKSAGERDGGPPGFNDDRLVTPNSAWRRARYLADQVRLAYEDELGEAGHCFVDWLAQCLDLIASGPSDGALRAHLLLERYDRENRSLESYLLEANDHATDDRDGLSGLLFDEAAATRNVVIACNKPEWLYELDRELKLHLGSDGKITSDEGALRVRQVLLLFMRRAIADLGGNQPRQEACDIIQALIEHSSDELVHVLAG